MTEIRSITGVPENEVAQRSAMVPKLGYIPYMSLTEGEMRLALLAQQAKMYAAYYGDKQYDRAAQMLDNALYQGVSNGVRFVGALYSTLEQYVASEISRASRLSKPASNGILLERPGMMRPNGALSGIHVGDPILPHDSTLDDCTKYAIQYVKKYYSGLSTGQIIARLAIPLLNQNLVKKFNEGKAICKSRREVEQLLNTGITDFGHHTLYGFLPNGGNRFPSAITTKRILQASGHEDLSRLAGSSLSNMKMWLNTAIMRRNAESNIGPLNELQSNVSWTGLPPEGIDELLAFAQVRPPRTGEQFAAKVQELIKKYGQPNIGVDPATATLIINTLKAIMLAVVAAAPAIINALKSQQADAFSGSRGIGTTAYGPETGDWNGDGIPDDGSSSSSKSLLWPLLLVGGAYLISQE